MTGDADAGRLTRAERWVCAGIVAWALALWAAAWVVPAVGRVPLLAWLDRPCALREGTGLPCPLCGGTRAAALTARGALGRAFLLNPAATALLAVSAAAAGWAAICLTGGRDWGFRRARRALNSPMALYVLCVGAAVLWGYKIVADCLFGVN